MNGKVSGLCRGPEERVRGRLSFMSGRAEFLRRGWGWEGAGGTSRGHGDHKLLRIRKGWNTPVGDGAGSERIKIPEAGITFDIVGAP
ncbi:MAG: hypothetical protein QW379_04620 [Thermoplasmata archaeon]